MKNQLDIKTRAGRSVYLLPNLLTISAMFAGFYAIIAGLQGHFVNAVIAILMAMVLDGLDGRVARLTNTQSQFGAQLDSLSDLISFGVAPAILLYSWTLSSLGKPGWLAAFVYTVCTALRLARFNTQTEEHKLGCFQGLPTPAAAGFVASLVWVVTVYQWPVAVFAKPLLVLTIVLGLLKVSSFEYSSFKNIGFKDRVPFFMILVVVLILALIALRPPELLLATGFLYIVMGPAKAVCSLVKKCPSPFKKANKIKNKVKKNA